MPTSAAHTVTAASEKQVKTKHDGAPHQETGEDDDRVSQDVETPQPALRKRKVPELL